MNLAKLCLDYAVNSDEVVYIGDSVADVVSCKIAKVDIFSVTFHHTYSYERLVKANPGKVCETVDELENKLFESIYQ